MSMYSEVKQHDTGNPWRGTIFYRNAALDLSAQVTTSTPVTFIMTSIYGGAPLVNKAPAVVESVNVATRSVVVRYDWQAGDVSIPDIYKVEVEFTLSGGTVTAPTDGTFIVTVLADLA